MSITNGYCGLPDLKHRLSIDADDGKDDTHLENVIEAVSRWIDSKTGTRFYTATETRYYLPELDWMVQVDPLVSVTSIKTDPNGDATYTYTWAATDYLLAPYNAAGLGLPYTWIERTPQGTYRFPVNPYRSRVQIVGSFGYSTLANVPSAIKEACILASMRVWLRKDKPFGFSGSADLGTLDVAVPLSRDGEIMALLSTIKRKPTL